MPNNKRVSDRPSSVLRSKYHASTNFESDKIHGCHFHHTSPSFRRESRFVLLWFMRFLLFRSFLTVISLQNHNHFFSGPKSFPITFVPSSFQKWKYRMFQHYQAISASIQASRDFCSLDFGRCLEPSNSFVEQLSSEIRQNENCLFSNDPVRLELKSCNSSEGGVEAVVKEISIDRIPMLTNGESREEITESPEEEFQRQIAQDAFDKGIEHWTSANMHLAMESFQSSLNVRESLFGTHHPDTAKSYLWVGAVHWNLGKHAKSLDTLCRSYRIKMTLANGDAKQCGIVSNWISRVLDDALDQALLKDKLEYLKMFQSSVTHELSGDQLAKEGQRENAIAEYRLALDLERRRRLCISNGASPMEASMTTSFQLSESPVIDVADLYSKIGIMYDLDREYDRAMFQYRKALSIYLATFGKTHPFTMAMYQQIGAVCRKKGWSDRAANDYLAVLYDSIVHEKTADMLLDRKGYMGALQEYLAAIALEESCSVGQLQLPSANMYIKAATIHAEFHNNVDLALPCYCKALGIYEMAFGSRDPDTVLTAEALRTIMTNTNTSNTKYNSVAHEGEERREQPEQGQSDEEQFEGKGRGEVQQDLLDLEGLALYTTAIQKQEKDESLAQEEEEHADELAGGMLIDLSEGLPQESKSFDKYRVYRSFWAETRHEADPFAWTHDEDDDDDDDDGAGRYPEDTVVAAIPSLKNTRGGRLDHNHRPMTDTRPDEDGFERARHELQQQQQGPLEMKQLVAKYTSQRGNKMDLDRPFQLSQIQSRPE